MKELNTAPCPLVDPMTIVYQVVMHERNRTENVGPVFNSLEQAQSFHNQCLRFAGDGIGQRVDSGRHYSIRVIEPA